ncbi:MAG: class I SAM-dependent methyltransferase [Candidatus Hodarchaeales archaeon]|jgi:ubiquinone/menaquinone biosynthesis C-methylase UbiE
MVNSENNSENNINLLIKKQFGREAEKYVHSPVHANQEELKWLMKDFIQPQKEWKALDIGTGAGHLAVNLASYVSKVIATDLTQEMLDQTIKQAQEKRLKNISTQIVDVHEIPFKTNSFDFVGCRIAAHHFHSIEKAIQEMIRVTNGIIYLQDTMAPSNKEAARYINHIEKLRDPSHIRTLSQDEWISLFKSNDCRIIKSQSKPKKWPLTWWTSRMSTPKTVVKEIIRLLENDYSQYSKFIDIRKREENNEWIIFPENIFLLAKKL